MNVLSFEGLFCILLFYQYWICHSCIFAKLCFLSRSPEVPDWTYDQILWTLGFSLILITAILGNTSVLWIITGRLIDCSNPDLRSNPVIAAHKCMWTITNYFLLNLTLSDLLMATFNMIPSFIFMRDRWGGQLSPQIVIFQQTPVSTKYNLREDE